MRQPLDFELLLQTVTEPTVVLTPDLIVRYTNAAFLAATNVSERDLIDRHLIDDVFPDRPGDEAAGRRALRESFAKVKCTAGSDVAGISKYDLVPAGLTRPVARYWSPVNSAVVDDRNSVSYIVHRVQDVTAGRNLLNGLLTKAAEFGTGQPAVDGQLTQFAQGVAMDGELDEQLRRLHQVIAARTIIEQAKGMLMAANHISADQAFEILKTKSQQSNIKLRDVAAHHVLLHSARFPLA